MNNSSSSKPLLITIICILLTLLLLIGIFVLYLFSTNSKKTSDVPDASVKTYQSYDEEEPEEITDAEKPGDSAFSSAPTNYIDPDVEEYVVNTVRPRYNEITNNQSLSTSSDSNGKTLYFDQSGILCRITYPKNYNNVGYERWYYFIPGNEMVFAFMVNGNEEHRFYYLNDELIRYISPNKITTDYPKDDNILAMSDQCLREAYSH